MTVKGIVRYGDNWIKGNKLIVAYNNSELYAVLKENSYIDQIEDISVASDIYQNRIKVQGLWFDFNGNTIVEEKPLGLMEDFGTELSNNQAKPSDIVIAESKKRRWGSKAKKELIEFYNQGMSIERLAAYFERDSEDVTNTLKKLKLI